MLTSIETGPLALGLAREAKVVGTGVFAPGLAVVFGVAGLEVAGGAWVVTAAGGGVGAAVATGTAVVADALVDGAAVTGAAVAGALVAGGAVSGGAVAAGGLVGMVGNTNEGAGVS